MVIRNYLPIITRISSIIIIQGEYQTKMLDILEVKHQNERQSK